MFSRIFFKFFFSKTSMNAPVILHYVNCVSFVSLAKRVQKQNFTPTNPNISDSFFSLFLQLIDNSLNYKRVTEYIFFFFARNIGKGYFFIYIINLRALVRRCRKVLRFTLRWKSFKVTFRKFLTKKNKKYGSISPICH